MEADRGREAERGRCIGGGLSESRRGLRAQRNTDKIIDIRLL